MGFWKNRHLNENGNGFEKETEYSFAGHHD